MASLDRLDSQVYEKMGEKSGWIEILSSESTSATRASELQLCTKAFGIMMAVTVNGVSGTPSFTPTIVVPDPNGGTDLTVATFTAITSSGVNLLIGYPGDLANMGDENLDFALPRDWKLSMAWSGADTTHNATVGVHVRYI